MSENPSSANDENREQGALESANSTPENEGAESNVDPEPFVKPKKPLNMLPGAVKLRTWLNKCLQIEMSDGRVLVGIFLCTDQDANIILGSCTEYLPDDGKEPSSTSVNDEHRMLGLVMVPGKHIVSISIDENEYPSSTQNPLLKVLKEDVNTEDIM